MSEREDALLTPATLPAIQAALAAAGVAPKPEWKLDGVNLLPYLTGEKSDPPHDMLYWRFGQQIALRKGECALAAEPVAGFAYRTDDVISIDCAIVGSNRQDIVPGLVKRRAHEVVHGGVDEAVAVLDRLNLECLADRRQIQRFDTNVLGAIYHVVEHFSMHTGQIIMLAKMQTAKDAGFYKLRADGTPEPTWTATGRPFERGAKP